MKLGAFSICLSTKAIKTSKKFYETFGYIVFTRDLEKNCLILKNENAIVGLFQGIFYDNILSFNFGYDESAQKMKQSNKLKDIQKTHRQKGIKLISEADEKISGPSSHTVMDPVGNVIHIDQNV